MKKEHPFLLLHNLFLIVFLVFTLLLTHSCTKDDDDNFITIDGNYLTEYIKVPQSYSVEELTNIYNLMAILEPTTTGFSENVESGVDIYIVNYKTTYKDEMKIASGLVCVPTDKTKNYPILSFHNGTNTSDALIPTNDHNNPNFKFLEGIAGMGYIVIIPDYLGFGASSDILHPYLHAASTVDAIIDLIYATKEFIDLDDIAISTNDQLFLMGYSQGGWATMHTHKAIESTPGLDLTVTASVCGAGSYDITEVKDYVFSQTTFPNPYYLAYISLAYQSMGLIEIPLSSIFNEPYASAIPALYEGMHTSEQINKQLTDTVASLLTANVLANFDTAVEFSTLRDAFEANSITAWNLDAPIKLYHGTEDVFVPYSVSESMYNNFIGIGNSSPDDIELIFIEGANHTGAIIPMGVASIEWFNTLKQ